MSSVRRAAASAHAILPRARCPKGKTAVVGMKDRATNQVTAKVIDSVDGETLNAFVDQHTDPEVEVYTDGATAYKGRKHHEAVSHSAGEYVRYFRGVKIHTNGVESFWGMLKRAHKGVYHKLSAKHLQRYVSQFAGRQNVREMDTLEQMQHVVAGLVGRRLTYRDLVDG
ncbi:MAG: IS1595 family transposase [Gammaproteobacteria bacterium]|nr:IS1595 family transposase [Gammaproteobacteria bacterium]